MGVFRVDGPTGWKSGVGRMGVFAVCVALASCVADQRVGWPGTTLGNRPPQGEPLRERAEKLWQARVEKDWAKVFLYQDPRDTEGATETEFVTWCDEKEPFRMESFEIGEVLVEEDMGWVHLKYSARIAKYATLPPRDAEQWEKWWWSAGQWYLVSRRARDAYPASPALRDADGEDQVLARFDEAWIPRLELDWDRLYEMTDPEDHGEVDLEAFNHGNELVEYLDHEVHWVQVIGDAGLVRVSYEYKLSDPSLTKLPPHVKAIDERWVRRDGEWYLDLK